MHGIVAVLRSESHVEFAEVSEGHVIPVASMPILAVGGRKEIVVMDSEVVCPTDGGEFLMVRKAMQRLPRHHGITGMQHQPAPLRAGRTGRHGCDSPHRPDTVSLGSDRGMKSGRLIGRREQSYVPRLRRLSNIDYWGQQQGLCLALVRVAGHGFQVMALEFTLSKDLITVRIEIFHAEYGESFVTMNSRRAEGDVRVLVD